MIDTVTFSVALSESQFEQLRLKSIEHIGRNNVARAIEYRIVKGEITVGSFDSKITIRCYEDDMRAQFQVSLPKQYYGHNIRLLPCSLVEQVLVGLQDKLQAFVGSFPPYREWRVERLDLCYAWRFSDQPTAEGVLRILSCFDFPRKNKLIYPKESINWPSRAYTLKFYLKAPEFLKHDYKNVSEEDRDKLNELYQFALGVLRFEITFRKQMLSDLFGGKEVITYKDLLDENHLVEILNKYKNKLFSNLNPKLTTDKQVMDILKKTYPHRKALRLYTFYKQFYSELPHEKQFLKDSYHQTTIWRNKRYLASAGVGIRSDIPTLDFSLDIPSALSTDLLPPAGAGGSA